MELIERVNYEDFVAGGGLEDDGQADGIGDLDDEAGCIALLYILSRHAPDLVHLGRAWYRRKLAAPVAPTHRSIPALVALTLIVMALVCNINNPVPEEYHEQGLSSHHHPPFIRDELKYEDGFDRHTKFHGTDDLISIDDLWKHWINSEVYNWTVDDVLDWLVIQVELPQYVDNFKVNAVDGHTLPRIASNTQFISNILGIKIPVHKQKLSLKTMDLVLFGAPKKGHNYLKDLALVALMIIAVGGCWLAYIQHRYSQSHLKKVMSDLDTLQTAEDQLKALRKKYDEAQKQQMNVAKEKHIMEKSMRDEIQASKEEAERLRIQRGDSSEEMSRLKLAEAELQQVRMALRRAEKEIEDRQNLPLAELQQWLQLTYEIENKHYELKRETAEKQLLAAKEMCEKIRRKRGAFMGSLRIAHTTSIDDTDSIIGGARAALEDIKMDLQERTHRWSEIEQYCGFSITVNPGLQALETALRGGRRGQVVAPSAVEDGDEDMPPGYMTAAVTPGGSVARSEPQVWPGLMQAGMQLTYLGLGLTEQQRAIHTLTGPGITSGRTSVSGKSTPTLMSAFGSQNSISSLQPHQFSGHKISPLRPVSSIPVMPPISDSESEESGTKNQVNGAVTFDIGGGPQDASPPIRSPAYDEAMNSTLPVQDAPPTYRQSVSLDSARPMVRPRTLPSSLSDGQFAGLPSQRNRSGTNTSTLIEEDSSPESTDSSTPAEEKKQKKKSKKLFSKLMRRDDKKSA